MYSCVHIHQPMHMHAYNMFKIPNSLGTRRTWPSTDSSTPGSCRSPARCARRGSATRATSTRWQMKWLKSLQLGYTVLPNCQDSNSTFYWQHLRVRHGLSGDQLREHKTKPTSKDRVRVRRTVFRCSLCPLDFKTDAERNVHVGEAHKVGEQLYLFFYEQTVTTKHLFDLERYKN